MSATFKYMHTLFLLLFVFPVLGVAQKGTEKCWPGAPKQKTLFIICPESRTSKRVLGPVSLSEGGKWRAYVEVDIQSDCMHTTRLWIARDSGTYRLVYMMPPQRTDIENGMEILGWAKDSSMLLVRTAEWQDGSDAAPHERVLAIDAGTGMVYEPELGAMLDVHKDKQCWFCIMDAGFAADPNVIILVRAKFLTDFELDETEKDVPPAKRCDSEETWSFNYSTGEIKQVPNATQLQIFNKVLPQGKKPPQSDLKRKPKGTKSPQ